GTRGGDYSAVTVDPVDGTFWAANMYKPSFAFWGTGIVDFALTDCAAPAGSIRRPVPASLAAIPGNQLLQLTGTSEDVEADALPTSPQHAVVAEMIIHNRDRSLDGLDPGKIRQGARDPKDDSPHEHEHFQAFPEG